MAHIITLLQSERNDATVTYNDRRLFNLSYNANQINSFPTSTTLTGPQRRSAQPLTDYPTMDYTCVY